MTSPCRVFPLKQSNRGVLKSNLACTEGVVFPVRHMLAVARTKSKVALAFSL